jgi:hypothetical protein
LKSNFSRQNSLFQNTKKKLAGKNLLCKLATFSNLPLFLDDPQLILKFQGKTAEV